MLASRGTVQVASVPISALISSLYETRLIPVINLNAAYERRAESGWALSYVTQARQSTLDVMAEDSAAAIAKPVDSEQLRGTSGSLLTTLMLVNDSSGDHGRLSIANEESRSEEQSNPAHESGQSSDGGEADGLVELEAGQPGAPKRKLASARIAVDGRLDRLTDLPVVQITESLFRDLLVMFDSGTQPQQTGEVSADDGMIELLAADVGTVASQRPAIPVAGQSNGVTLQAGVAFAQALEIMGIDDIASAVPPADGPSPAAVAASEQLVRAD
jgi:hypothetical protein